jgi:eukaryotic-like serine/threonine-protein kinase
MSPEQCRGAGKVDSRSDLYSLGCLLYVLLCGRPPFVAEGPGDIIAHHLYFPPDPPSRLEPSIPVGVEQLVLSLLQKEPDARPATATAVMETIDRINGAGGGPSGRPPTHSMFPSQIASRPPVQAAAKHSTTLSGSASQLRHPATPQTIIVRPRSRRVLYAGIGGVLISGGLAAVLLRSGGEEVAAQVPRATAALMDAASPGEPPKAISPALSPEPDAPPAPVPEVVQLAIESDPSGAQVLFDNKVVGSTPYAETLPKTGTARTYTLRKNGYADQKATFTGARDDRKQLKLKKKPAPAPAPAEPGYNPFK